MTVDWVDELLSDTRAIVRELLDEALIPIDVLQRDVQAYESSIQDALAADQELGLALAARSSALLEAAKCETSHRLAQVAVRYFVMDDDGDDDLASAFGFDDDVEVFNAVASELGREDLLITLD